MTNQQGAPEALYASAMEFAAEKASISYVQRKCRCSWNDAEQMLERMVREGIIATYNGRKSAALVEAQQPASSAAVVGRVAELEDVLRAVDQLFDQTGELAVPDGCRWGKVAGYVKDALAAAPQPSPTPQADSQPAMTPETVYAAIAHGDEEHRAWLLSALRAVWCGEAVPLVASPIANAPADSVLEDAARLDWQDISTAPKDGTRFVAVGNNYGLDSETQHTCIAQWFRGCWMEVSDWNEASELKYLTHWMPLPPLPGSAARKQGDE